LRYLHSYPQNTNIIFRYLHLHHFFTIRICAIVAVIIRYSQIGNERILNAFKNNFDRFAVFWACFENIIQHQKYVESRKKNGLWI
jgi:hypothetical protein